MASFQPSRLAYNTHEPVNGADENLAPVIYLHGATVHKETWGDIPQIVANATKRKSYSLDARNHGDSEWTDEFDFDLNADDLIHFMDSLDIKKAILVGSSMGGITSVKTALKRPDRIEKIVVEDMFVRKLSQQIIDTVLMYVTLMRKAVEEAPSELGEDAVKKFLLKSLLDNIPPDMKPMTSKTGDANYVNIVALRRHANGRYTLKCNLEVVERALRNPETLASEPQGRFEGPAYFIYGKASPFLVGADEDHIKQFFPKAILEGIEDTGHDVHFAKPLEFTDALLKFIS